MVAYHTHAESNHLSLLLVEFIHHHYWKEHMSHSSSNTPEKDSLPSISYIGEIFQLNDATNSGNDEQTPFPDGALSIPAYQRPYKWQHKHVLQLLQDLQHHAEKDQEYRLGTLVLHSDQDRKSLDVVDGQQRLVTLSLILHCLGQENIAFIDNATFQHSISQHNIRSNYAYIRRYIAESGLDKQNLQTFILQRCQLIWVLLTDLEEAFQFFDSQNARGKPLEPYDLLKAYHLRAIPNSEPALMQYVETWEQSVHGDPDLDLIISKRLYRLRQWLRFGDGEAFSTDELSLFKGVNEYSNHPYLQAQRAGMALHRNHAANPMMYDRLYALPPFHA